MSKFMLAKKIEMSQLFDEAGKVHAVTWLEAGPLVVTQVRTLERDGYNAVQFGFGEKSKKNTAKAQQGHLKELNARYLRESRSADGALKRGDTQNVSIFEEGSRVRISAVSKGKGFQGVVKRHGFKGGSRTHGQKHSEREPGSIGAVWPQRVLKGMRMAGRMGGERATYHNVKVVKIIADKNLMAVAGAVPGHRGTLVEIQG